MTTIIILSKLTVISYNFKLDYNVKEATNWVCKHEWFKHSVLNENYWKTWTRIQRTNT